jgi:hypothetical protein
MIKRGLIWLASRLLTRFARYAVPEHETVLGGQRREYVDADLRLGPIVIAAGQNDVILAFENPATAEATQGELNAFHQFLLSDRGKGWLTQFMGSLVAQGIPPDQAIIQMGANLLLIGAYVQRRLEKA